MQKPLQRVEIYRQARVILVRQLIDIGRLCITVTGHHIHLKGSLHHLPGVTTRLTPATIRDMFSAMRRIPGIARVDGSFDNWKLVDEQGQAWVEVHVHAASLAGRSGTFIAGSHAHDLT